MNTHISCPPITSVDISTQKSVLWTWLICGRLPLRLDWWFKAKLWWFVILFIFSAYIRLIFLLFSVPHFLDFLTFTPSLYTHSFYIIIIFSYNLSNVLSSCHFYCYILIGFPIFYFFFTSPITHPPPTTVERFADLGDSMSPLQPWGVHWSGQASERRSHRAAAAGGETTRGLRLHWERPAAAGSNGGWGQVWKLMIIYWCCLSWKTVLIELCISS